MNISLFSQLAALGASLTLLLGVLVLWRRNLHSYIDAFQWQSAVLALLFVVIGYFGHDAELYLVAFFIFVLKVIVIPRYLARLEKQVNVENEAQPYVNVPTSLILAGLLVLLAYVITYPLMQVTTLPTRSSLPLAMGLIFIGLLILATRKQALTQVVGFLILENGITLLAGLGTYGIPLIVELGVFLDVLMGFLVMQVLIYQIHGTFETIDVEQLNQLRH